MEDLPLLVLDTVCEYLTDIESNRASLRSFALTSKTCYAVARRQLFSEIRLDKGPQPFRQRLLRLEEFLDRSSARNFVRTLRVGCLVNYTSRIEAQFSEEAVWTPLVRFISTLALKNLVWDAPYLVPCCILSALRDKLPSCRLYLEYLDLSSLHETEAFIGKTYMLATLPNLHSIRVPYSNAGWGKHYKGNSVLQMAAGLAPGLRHVSIREAETENAPWRGSFPVPNDVCHVPAGTKGKLTSLTIEDSWVSGSLARWDAHTDFSVLRTLQLPRIDLSALRVLTALAERDQFRCLRDLDLGAKRASFSDRDETESMMTRLLLSLCPLVNLALVAIGEAAYNAAISRHGARLRVLRVKDTILSGQGIDQLVQSCPTLQALDIEILRSASDRVEVATYRSLGTLRSLESLSLGLHCIAHHPENSPYGPRIAHSIREVLINTALDAQLALSIAQTITAAHPLTAHNLPPRLREIKLRIRPINSKSYRISKSLLHLLELIGRGWEYRLDPRDTHQGAVHIEELPESVRARMNWNVTQWFERLIWDDTKREKTAVLNAWKALWPATGANWMDKWRSTPLATRDWYR
jgi:hypothetical protein